VVPRECVVIPQLVRFESLEADPEVWTRALEELAARPRDVTAANRRVGASPFSITRSAEAMLRLYRDGVLP
jgi:hypothetical protein